MHYFLDIDFDPATGILNEEESHHAVKSLRVVAGDKILIGDGRGRRFFSTVKHIGKKEIIVDIVREEVTETPKKTLTIAIAPTKNPSRFEWFIEKATELGVYQIIPLLTQHTERPRFKQDRAARIIHAAAKQSMRAFIPHLAELTPFADVMALKHTQKLIAHCHTDTHRVELSSLNQIPKGEIMVLIGPEGDFSIPEVKLAEKNGYTPIGLGPNRLRTETAGVYVAAQFY